MLDSQAVLSVSALTAAIKRRLEDTFPFVWVRGQVTNVTRPSSGHVYFSLRDSEASLGAVWFRTQHEAGERFDPLTGEVFEDGPRQSLAATLHDGQEVVCAGRLRVYEPRGVYQLVVELAEDLGLGRLQLEFNRLREQLAADGFFALERKRALPSFPNRVALITSPQGAAIHDFWEIASKRGCGSQIRLYPVLVQGDSAPAQIAAAFQAIADSGWAEVVVLIRGGGSLEDLWAFNTEQVARAVFISPVPVLAGIGHEIDFTLADMTADMRAATPSHAAQLLWQEKAMLIRQLTALGNELRIAGRMALAAKHDGWTRITEALNWNSPLARIRARQRDVGRLTADLEQSACASLAVRSQWIERLEMQLGIVPGRLPVWEAHLAALRQQLQSAGTMAAEKAKHLLERYVLTLEGLDPHAPLERGYALVSRNTGDFVRRKRDVQVGECLRVRVAEGEFMVRVAKEEECKKFGE